MHQLALLVQTWPVLGLNSGSNCIAPNGFLRLKLKYPVIAYVPLHLGGGWSRTLEKPGCLQCIGVNNDFDILFAAPQSFPDRVL